MAGDREASCLAILAGGGDLPLEVADRVVAAGRPVHVIAIRGEADSRIERFSHSWIKFGAFGQFLRTIKSQRCGELVIIGKVSRPDLRNVRPDLGFVTHLPAMLQLMRGGDDALLTRAVRLLEAKGVTVRGAHEVAPDLVASAGVIGRNEPDALHCAAIERGFALIRALGPYDVGQAAVVSGQNVIAIEAAEGTDRMLQRVAEMPRVGGDTHAVIVKCPKPGQELRVDMPVIGAQTVERAAAAGLAGIAVESGTVILANRSQLRAAADAKDMFLVASRQPATTTSARFAPHRANANRVLSRRRPGQQARRDIAFGTGLMDAARPFGCGRAVALFGGYVIAVEAGEGLEALISRYRAHRPWGRLMFWRGSGVLVVDAGAPPNAGDPPAKIAAQVAAAGIGGVAIRGGAAMQADFIEPCNRHGLFLVAVPARGHA